MNENVLSIADLEWEMVDLCPGCNAGLEQHSQFDTYMDMGLELSYSFCRNCGLVFQSPRPTGASLEAFYQAAYRRRSQGYEGPSEKDRRIQAGRARNLMTLLREMLPEPKKVLDIGCSTGEFLIAVQRVYGSFVTGIEPGEAYRRHALDRGIEVLEDLNNLTDRRARDFDLVSLLHVLEHLPAPLQTLKEIRAKWLSEGGYLLIEVPNYFGHQAYELAHLTAFSPEALRNLLHRAGFRVVMRKVHGQPRSNLLPLYLTYLAQPIEHEAAIGGVEDESRVRRRRRRAMQRRRIINLIIPRLAWKRLPDLATGKDK